MRALAVLLVALVAAVAPVAAASAPPPDLSQDPLDRAALLTLPSIYRVTVTYDVPALVASDGTRLRLGMKARRIVESGTAFGVSTGGWLATARHVVAPGDDNLAEMAYRNHLIHSGQAHSDAAVDAYLERTAARPADARRVRVDVTQAEAGAGARASRTWRPVRIVPSDTADLALVRVVARGAPALPLDEAASIGTPVVSVGFGRASAIHSPADGLGELEPAIRRGTLSRTGTLEDEEPVRQAIAISVPVQGGDSGAPVVDADGRVRGVVIQSTRSGGIAERATELRQLMESADVTPTTGRAAAAFRQGMEALWRLDPGAAEQAFDATLAAFPEHTLAATERTRAEELADARIQLAGERRPQGVLLGLGVLAGVIALGFGAALLAPHIPRGGPSPRGR